MTAAFSFRFAALAAVSAIALLHVTAASARTEPRAPIFNESTTAVSARLPALAQPNSGVTGTLNASVMNAPAIDLTLADGQVVTARLQRVVRDDNKQVQSWIGTFDDAPGSSLVLSKAKGVVTGFANYQDQTIEILPSAAGKHIQFTVDSKRMPKDDDGMIVSSSGGGDELASTESTYGTGATTLASGTAVVQDLLVFYTAASASTYGSATIESMIRSAVQSANQAYVNSGVNITLNLVGLKQTSMTESGSGSQTTLSNLKKNSTVRSLRDQLGADMVVLVSEDSNYCGYASLQFWTTNGVTTTDAYAVAYSKCLSTQTLAHEVGHLQQLDHNRENSTGTSAGYPYSYGYRKCVTNGFMDIMSYSCTGAARLLQFSTPNRTYNGYSTGIAYESDPSHAADAARSLNDTAVKVANYKKSISGSVAPTVPATPSGLASRGATYQSVALGWSDNSSVESGYKVERSLGGVNFTEIASLGAGATSYTDGTVSAQTTYYYRVRAYNSAGVSGYSNVVSVTTPAASTSLPLKPSGLAVRGTTYRSVALGWSDNSSVETGYKVERSVGGVNYTVIASLGAGATSYTDGTVSAQTTYYYRVRAYNSAGVSGYSNVVSVTTPAASTSLPATPTGLVSRGATYKSIALGWSDNSAVETGYKVERSVGGVNYTVIASLGAGATSYTDGTVSAQTTYYYRVRAYNSAGVSGYSNVVNVTTPAASTSLPATPSGLVSRGATYRSVTLGWSDNSAVESGYKVERSRDGVNFTEIASLGAGATSYTDGTVSARTKYYYRVRAYNGAGVSGYSNVLSVTTPALATTVPNGAARVTWTDASNNETSFEVWRKNLSSTLGTWGSLTKIGVVPTGTTQLVDTAGNGTYRYYVRAVNSAGASAYAGPAQVTITSGA